MKARVLTSIGVALMLMISMNLMGQIFIPKAGVAVANASISDDIKENYNSPDMNFKVGFVGGLAVDFQINELISIQPELLFHQKGYVMKATEGTSTYEETVSLNYLELPVMIKFNFGNFYANAGPTFAYGLGGTYKVNYSYQGADGSYDGKIKFGEEPEDYEGDDWYAVPFEVGLGIGAGYKLLDKVLLDLRYGMGFTSFWADDEDFDWSSMNRSIQFTIAYPIPLSK